MREQELRLRWEPQLNAYVVYAGRTMLGQATNLAEAVEIIRFWQDENEYTSKICSNESDEKQRSSAAQKSQ